MTVVAEVVRSGFVESRHHGSLVALGPDGEVLLSVGSPERPVFPRSSNKPLQASAMVRLGVADKLGFDDRHLAIAAASHTGEDMHVEIVTELLARAGLGPAALGCPPDLPLYAPAARALLARGGGPDAIHHNCSGKHACMVAACVTEGWPVPAYRDPEHPLQRHIRSVVEELCGERVTAVGVDGCGAPLFALTLTGLARGFARVTAAPADSAEGRVAAAMRAHPLLVGGTDRDVSALLPAVPGLVAKDGAEAVFAAALPDGTAVALKIEDGGSRAATPVLVAALRALGVPGDDAVLDRLADPPVLGGGERVGEVRAVLG